MDKLIAKVIEFRGDDELSTTHVVIHPIAFDDGTVEFGIDLVGEGLTAFVRFSIGELVTICSTAERQE